MFAMLFLSLQSLYSPTCRYADGAVKQIPVVIQLFQQTGLEISIRFRQTFVSHRIVMHVHVQMNTHVNDNFFQVFLSTDPPYTWLFAKMRYNVADSNYHQVLTHLGTDFNIKIKYLEKKSDYRCLIQ